MATILRLSTFLIVQILRGKQTAFAIGAFSTTFTALSLALMEWRGVTTTNVYIGNFFFVAGSILL